MRTDCHMNRHKFSSFLLLLTFKVLIVNHPFISSSLVIMLRYYKVKQGSQTYLYIYLIAS